METQQISVNLWFDRQAEEAVQLYTSIFKNSSIERTTYYNNEGHEIHKMPDGMVMTIEFTLNGQKMVALNGGPIFHFSEAVSLAINCETQEEIDYYWEKLKAGGDEKAQECGWLKDKFGVSWQVTSIILSEMLIDADKARQERVTKAMLQMKKLDIAKLKEAYDGKTE